MFSNITIRFLLCVFPLLGFTSLLVFLQIRGKNRPDQDWGLNVLRAAVLYGVYQVLVLELLSLFKAITPTSLVLSWSALILPVSLWVIRRKEWSFRPKITVPEDWPSRLLMTIVVLVVLITLTVAWITPPQTWDSLTYHSARIAHWAQNRSIDHYITGIERQNSMSPGAEFLSLGLYVLTNRDRLSAILQWTAMVLSLVAARVLARRLDLSPFGQWLAVVFVVTLPIGIVEASSTITDYVAAFWVLCAAAELLSYWRGARRDPGTETRSVLFISLAAGMGFLTKPTVAPYMLAFALVLGTLLLKRSGVFRTLRWAFLAVVLVLAINSGYLTRNLRTYGGLSNPVDFSNHVNQLHTPAGFLSNVIKNLGLHAGLPLPSYNDWLDLMVVKVHVKMGVDIQDPRTTGDGYFAIRYPSTQEDLTTNPYHAYLMVLTVPLLLITSRKNEKVGVAYALLVLAAFVIYSGLFKWHVFNGRYHIAFFVLFAPALAYFWGQERLRWHSTALGITLLILAFPWLFSIQSRPLFPTRASLTPSIFNVPRAQLAAANLGGSGGQDVAVLAQRIRENSCQAVGMMLLGDDPEYLFWPALGAPRTDLRIEWIVVATPSERYRPEDFQPCALLCRGCSEERVILGNVFSEERSGFQLFLKP